PRRPWPVTPWATARPLLERRLLRGGAKRTLRRRCPHEAPGPRRRTRARPGSVGPGARDRPCRRRRPRAVGPFLPLRSVVSFVPLRRLLPLQSFVSLRLVRLLPSLSVRQLRVPAGVSPGTGLTPSPTFP